MGYKLHNCSIPCTEKFTTHKLSIVNKHSHTNTCIYMRCFSSHLFNDNWKYNKKDVLKVPEDSRQKNLRVRYQRKPFSWKSASSGKLLLCQIQITCEIPSYYQLSNNSALQDIPEAPCVETLTVIMEDLKSIVWDVGKIIVVTGCLVWLLNSSWTAILMNI